MVGGAQCRTGGRLLIRPVSDSLDRDLLNWREKTVTLKRAGLALIAFGLTISALTYSWTRAMNTIPLSVPITLSPGHFQSPVFQAHASTQHVVSVAFDGTLGNPVQGERDSGLKLNAIPL